MQVICVPCRAERKVLKRHSVTAVPRLLNVILFSNILFHLCQGRPINITSSHGTNLILMPYTSNQNVTYTCEGEDRQDIFLNVIVNGHRNQLQTPNHIERFASQYGIYVAHDQQRLNLLTFTATSFAWTALLKEFHSPVRLVFRCQDYTDSSFSSNQTIIVYGKLEAPSNVTHELIEDNYLHLYWDGPKVPDGVNITYQVYVKSVSTGDTREFVTSEEFIDIDVREVCGELKFTIVAHDEHGGLSSMANTSYNISSVSPDVSNVAGSVNAVAERRDKTETVTFMFSPAISCNEDLPLVNYTLMLGGITSITVPASNSSCGDYVCINVRADHEITFEQIINITITACTVLSCVATGLFTVLLVPGVVNPHPTDDYEHTDTSHLYKVFCFVFGAILIFVFATILVILACWCINRKQSRSRRGHIGVQTDQSLSTDSRETTRTIRRTSTLEQATTETMHRRVPCTATHRSDGSELMTSSPISTELESWQLSKGPQRYYVAQCGDVDSLSVSIQMDDQEINATLNGGSHDIVQGSHDTVQGSHDIEQESRSRQDGEHCLFVMADRNVLSNMSPSSCSQTFITSEN